MKDTVADYVWPSHANSHGLRKGAGTYATSGTTCPPPISSVAGRGEWSMGRVFDVYWTFCMIGDFYLGKLLAGFDPNSSSFACFPPHFVVEIENKDVKEDLESSFRKIIERCRVQFPNIQGLLLRCLSCMVHHSEKIMQIIETNPRNPLANIPLFSNAKIFHELKQLVLTKASIKFPRVTGIPPHVNMIVTLQDLIDNNAKEASERKKQFERMGEIVSEKLEAIAADNGTLTRSSVTQILAKEFDTFKF